MGSAGAGESSAGAGESFAGAGESFAGAGESSAGTGESSAGAGESSAGAGESSAGTGESSAGAGEPSAGDFPSGKTRSSCLLLNPLVDLKRKLGLRLIRELKKNPEKLGRVELRKAGRPASSRNFRVIAQVMHP